MIETLYAGLRVLVYFLLIGVTIFIGQAIGQNASNTIVMLGFATIILVLSIYRFKLAFFFIIFSMLLSPEITVASTAKREVSLRLEDFILLVLTFSWVIRIAIYKEIGLILKSPINVRVSIYLFICALSTSLGMMTGRVTVSAGFFFVVKYIEFYFIYILLLNNIHVREEVEQYVWAILLTAFIICLLGFRQFFAGEVVSTPFEGKVNPEYNTLGGYLVLMFSLALGLALRDKRPRVRITMFALCVMIMSVLMISMSRGSWVAFIGTFIFFVIFCRAERKYLASAGLILMVLVPLFSPRSTRDRLFYTFGQKPQEEQITVLGVTLDPSTSARLVSYKQAIRVLAEHPILGHGVTGSFFIDSQYFRSLVEIGLLGLLAFLWMVGGILKFTGAVYRQETGFHSGLALGFMGGTVGLLIHSISANTFIIVRIMEPFWFLTGMIIFLYNERLPVEAPFTPEKPLLRS